MMTCLRHAPRTLWAACLALAALATFLWGCNHNHPSDASASTMNAAPASTVFPTPERAVEALQAAAKMSDAPTLHAIFGPDGREILSSGDPVADRRARQVFTVAMDERWRLDPAGPDRRELIIGDEQWPFPVPLVRESNGWRFDGVAGKREVLARRIGRNELFAIGICETYVTAQRQYAAEPRDDNPAGCYAQKVRSAPGRHDGLYWPAAAGQPRSPLGDLAAQAESEGYQPTAQPADASPRPFHGYLFRILTRQGPAAPGGARDYVVNGRMTGGFALIATPADYGNSGIMTFIVNQDGVIHEADLGPDSAKTTATITAYDPDPRFHRVD